jgi:hypothetical protein
VCGRGGGVRGVWGGGVRGVWGGGERGMCVWGGGWAVNMHSVVLQCSNSCSICSAKLYKAARLCVCKALSWTDCVGEGCVGGQTRTRPRK